MPDGQPVDPDAKNQPRLSDAIQAIQGEYERLEHALGWRFLCVSKEVLTQKPRIVLPTERQAEKDGISPQAVTQRNIETFKRQMNLVGLCYDWDRELATSEVDYYRWTQWIFNLLFERGLAYQAEVAVTWCPALGTVVANEEVQDGVYIDTGDPVERRNMRQWLLRITQYADRLARDLDLVDWSVQIKDLQRNWIGRSEGAVITFRISGAELQFDVFSSRPENEAVLRPASHGTTEAFVRVLAPFAPHLAEELWERLGNHGYVLDAPWPEHDESKLLPDTATVVVQVNGRRRCQVLVPRGASEEAVLLEAMRQHPVSSAAKGNRPSRVIYRPDQIINLVFS